MTDYGRPFMGRKLTTNGPFALSPSKGEWAQSFCYALLEQNGARRPRFNSYHLSPITYHACLT